MNRVCFFAVVALALIGFGVHGQKRPRAPEPVSALHWIWFDEGNPLQDAPAETRYFRKVFTVDRPVAKPVDEGTLDITADDAFTVWVNGKEVGKGNRWERVYRFDVTALLVHGKNVVAVEAKNDGAPAGLLVLLGYIPNGQSKQSMVSDGSWIASRTAAAGWQKLDFDDAKWAKAKALVAYGQGGPWKGIVWDTGGDDRFAVPPGFVVEMVVPTMPKDKELSPYAHFSFVNMTFDAKGRLLVSQENGPVLLCTEPDKKGVFQNIRPYCTQVKNCQGMCWVDDALLLVGDGPQGAALYRTRDTDGDDKIDDVKLLHKFQGGMGEHGPHAIIHGPDNWLYLVIGNHAWAKPDKLASNSPLTRWPHGTPGPDQGKPGTTEDVLLKRLNDSRGHAADILAPGGTIWRLDKEGKNMSLVAAGFRNHFDAAFSPDGELFTFDSDMEWDEALPWYRAVRACHCPPGADFLWRTGAANTPDYYIDSLPPLVETGRGSPVGVEFYDHVVFPEKYRGAYFMCDWAIGVIYAVHLERDGATYKPKIEKFCVGNPMNVTDCAVGPDGALYFTVGGRGTQGGAFRIVYHSVSPEKKPPPFLVENGLVFQPQPFSAWARSGLFSLMMTSKFGEWEKALLTVAKNPSAPAKYRIQALNRWRDLTARNLAEHDDKVLPALSQDKNADVRAYAIWAMSVDNSKGVRANLLDSLKDADALVRRRACEALIRAGIEPAVDDIWRLLNGKDRFVRSAARLVLQRIDPGKWADRLATETTDHAAWEAIIALCKIDKAAPHADAIFARLKKAPDSKEPQPLLDYLRTVQMALIHLKDRPSDVNSIASNCLAQFPHADYRVNRELAILLADFRLEKLIQEPVHDRLLSALLGAQGNRQQQIHYFYCLRLLKDGWTPEQKTALLNWFESTKGWIGGHSFGLFLEHILRDLMPIFARADLEKVLAEGDKKTYTVTALLRYAKPDQAPPLTVLAGLYERLGKTPSAAELRTVLLDQFARSAAATPSPDNWPILIRALDSNNPVIVFDVLRALKKVSTKPKAEEGGPYRAVLLAAKRVDSRNRWGIVELLRQWTNGRQFGAEPGDAQTELAAWTKWFNQTFPKEPPLPDTTVQKPAESKYKFEDLLTFLDKDPAGKKGDPVRGRLVFEKGTCFKCHKYGKEGEGIGPDLTTLSKRFKRIDTLESMFYPSKVISDQYRSTTIETKNGQRINGLAAPQGDMVTVLQSDGTKITLKKSDIDQQFASLVSVMPEKLLDPLTKEEIADLFAFLESEPK